MISQLWVALFFTALSLFKLHLLLLFIYVGYLLGYFIGCSHRDSLISDMPFSLTLASLSHLASCVTLAEYLHPVTLMSPTCQLRGALFNLPAGIYYYSYPRLVGSHLPIDVLDALFTYWLSHLYLQLAFYVTVRPAVTTTTYYLLS